MFCLIQTKFLIKKNNYIVTGSKTNIFLSNLNKFYLSQLKHSSRYINYVSPRITLTFNYTKINELSKNVFLEKKYN